MAVTAMATTTYNKHFIPLESNPELFAQLMHQLGGSLSLSFDDVFSIDDPHLIACVRMPVNALILTFPTTQLYEEDKRIEEDDLKVASHDILPSDILWFKQTINNACGLYGLLHAVCNSAARNFIGKQGLEASKYFILYILSPCIDPHSYRVRIIFV
jgi:ubiquitin carboxyl-terminal hydrolase L3